MVSCGAHLRFRAPLGHAVFLAVNAALVASQWQRRALSLKSCIDRRARSDVVTSDLTDDFEPKKLCGSFQLMHKLANNNITSLDHLKFRCLLVAGSS